MCLCDEHAHYYSLRCHRLRNHRVLPIRCMCARRHLFTVYTHNKWNGISKSIRGFLVENRLEEEIETFVLASASVLFGFNSIHLFSMHFIDLCGTTFLVSFSPSTIHTNTFEIVCKYMQNWQSNAEFFHFFFGKFKTQNFDSQFCFR